MAVPFISLQDLEDYLELPTGAIRQDLATIALDSACEIVKGYTDQLYSKVKDEFGVDTTVDVHLVNGVEPSDVRLVALQVAARTYEFGPYNNEAAAHLTPGEKGTLRRYRL